MGDFSRRTLERRASKIPEMLGDRKEGKTAFMVMDKLIIYDRPPDPDKNRNAVLNFLKMMMMTKNYLATGYIENNLPGNSSYHVKHDIQAASVLFHFRKVFTLYIVVNPTCFYLRNDYMAGNGSVFLKN